MKKAGFIIVLLVLSAFFVKSSYAFSETLPVEPGCHYVNVSCPTVYSDENPSRCTPVLVCEKPNPPIVTITPIDVPPITIDPTKAPEPTTVPFPTEKPKPTIPCEIPPPCDPRDGFICMHQDRYCMPNPHEPRVITVTPTQVSTDPYGKSEVVKSVDNPQEIHEAVMASVAAKLEELKNRPMPPMCVDHELEEKIKNRKKFPNIFEKI